jgi:hypothetical protein
MGGKKMNPDRKKAYLAKVEELNELADKLKLVTYFLSNMNEDCDISESTAWIALKSISEFLFIYEDLGKEIEQIINDLRQNFAEVKIYF